MVAWKGSACLKFHLIYLCPSLCFGLSVCLPLSLSLVVFVHPSAFGNCGSSLRVACSVPSQGLQPGGDAREDPPCAGPSPRDCRASAPAPPWDPMTGVCLEVKTKSQQTGDQGSGAL